MAHQLRAVARGVQRLGVSHQAADQPPTGQTEEVPYNGFDAVKVTLTYSNIDAADRTYQFVSASYKWPLLRRLTSVTGRNQFVIDGTGRSFRLQSIPLLPVGNWPRRPDFGLLEPTR